MMSVFERLINVTLSTDYIPEIYRPRTNSLVIHMHTQWVHLGRKKVLPCLSKHRMNHYVATVRDHVAGQGVVTQVDKDDDDDLPPPPTEEELLLVQLSIEEKRSRDGIFLARPIQPANDSIGGSPATASSPSRNASPSEDDVTVNQRSCQGCNGPLRLGDVAIRADRAGTDKMWHPQCFKCFACEVNTSAVPVH